MKTVVITFSSRPNGNCSQIGKLIASLMQDSVLFDFSEFDLHPCGRCTAECFVARENCPYFEDKEYEMLDTMIHSDVVYFVLPNYCDYPCANFFIFNERSQCYFQGRPELLDNYLKVPKRSIVISNTNEENFVRALGYQSEKEPEILFLSAKKYGKKSIDGDLLTQQFVIRHNLDSLFIGKHINKATDKTTRYTLVVKASSSDDLRAILDGIESRIHVSVMTSEGLKGAIWR